MNDRHVNEGTCDYIKFLAAAQMLNWKMVHFTTSREYNQSRTTRDEIIPRAWVMVRFMLCLPCSFLGSPFILVLWVKCVDQ